MQTFTGWEYLLIDAANQWGLDKELFEKRLEWASLHLDKLETLAEIRDYWKEKPLYLKAVQAIRKAQQGTSTGHLVGFDAVCSGMQIMSALTGCIAGARATGLVDPNRRADAYTDCTGLMQKRIPTLDAGARREVKQAVMTSLYGSKQEPKNLFGDGTPELNAFNEAMYELAPGACELLDDLLNSWRPYALYHSWKMPDGFDVRIKVMQEVEKRIEVDELNHATFTYRYYENEGTERGVANAANVVHSFDAYVVRSIERRCNYDKEMLTMALRYLLQEGIRRELNGTPTGPRVVEDTEFDYYLDQYNRSGLADVVILPYLTKENVKHLNEVHLDKLINLAYEMSEYEPFPVITVHDEFKCHPNHMNHLRKQYANILADLAESPVLDDVLSQLYGTQGTFPKKSPNLGETIRNSNYALC